MSKLTCLRRSILFSINRTPLLFTQLFPLTSSSRARSFHRLNVPLQEQCSISFGPTIDKLLEPKKRKLQGGAVQANRGRIRKTRNTSSVETSLAALLDKHASQRASRSAIKDSSLYEHAVDDLVQSEPGSIEGRSSELGVQQEDQEHIESALELSGDAYNAISQPRHTIKSLPKSMNPSRKSEKDGRSVKESRAPQASSPREQARASTKPVRGTQDGISSEQTPRKKREPWQEQKNALTKKFGEVGWSPRKKLSPDAIEGIRSLHEEDPERYTTPILSQQFKVSPEAIRRILKSKWRATPEKMDERRVRWARRFDRIWDQKAALGLRPPRTSEKEPEGPEVFEEEVRAKQLLGKL